ncbi:leucine-rich repeat extensin-like protein 5 isoform X2 [Contarinia nasturtii]|uniref:leucine-rich repeat extensin-like protein 5 isoform X2 n=1 Tax=Contarinia nasturtii TaxID=265458 RepID=UPI0012D39551|nr:leucine-rich repeat extensin-like protein 5 isoform X2 [Contarinia nasturtii]
MKVFVVLSCIALAVAKPQGYSYNQPSSSSFGGSHNFGVSAPSVGLSTPGFAAAPSFTGSAPSSSSFSGSSSFGSSFGSSGSSFGGAQPSFSSGSSFGGAQPSFSSGSSFGGAQPSFSSGSSFGGSFAPQPQPQQALIQKHIYVHVPPPQEDEFAQPHNAVAPVQAQKHYKIIFIKAPSAPSVSAQQLQQLAQPQTEEKTLVYVLVKKPESVSELTQNLQAAPTQPSKPEVYFIKYKAQKEQSSLPVQSGSAEASLPIPAPSFVPSAPAPSFGPSAPAVPHHKPSPVYGPAH